MDCIVHGVAKSRTRLSDFHFHLKKKKKNRKTIGTTLRLVHAAPLPLPGTESFPGSMVFCAHAPALVWQILYQLSYQGINQSAEE